MALKIGEGDNSNGFPVPEKHFSKWLQTESQIEQLRIWIGFAKYVLGLGTIAGLTIFICNKFPDALKNVPAIVAGICSLAGAGVAVGINKYRNRK